MKWGELVFLLTHQIINFNKKKIEEEIRFLREWTYSDGYMIGINGVSVLKTLNDPKLADTNQKNQLSTSTKQIPMR